MVFSDGFSAAGVSVLSSEGADVDAHAASDHFAEYIVGIVRPVLTGREVTFAEVL